MPLRRKKGVVGTGAGGARRILIIDHTAELGGAEVALLRLLSGLNRTRFPVMVLLFANGPLVGRLRELKVRVQVLELDRRVVGTARNRLGSLVFQPGKWIGILAHFWKVVQFIREGQFALVHTTSLKADLLGGFAARIAGCPLLWHLHDRIAADYLPAKVVKALRFLARRLPQFVVANSEATRRTLESFPDGRITVIYPGVPEALLEEGADDQLRAPTESPVVGIVGRISPTKGQDIFIRAAALVVKRFPATRFQMIGAPLFNHEGYDREIRRLATGLGLENLEFTGFCDDVTKRMRALSVMVHASPTPEPFGQVVVEAMAMGTPVVATDGGGIPEIVIDGECGYLAPPGDIEALAERICALLENPERARAMAICGRERVAAHFTAGRMASRFEQVYERLMVDG